MGNTPYCVTEHIAGHLPVYKVQLIVEITRSRVLHGNFLFPFAIRNGWWKTMKCGRKGI